MSYKYETEGSVQLQMTVESDVKLTEEQVRVAFEEIPYVSWSGTRTDSNGKVQYNNPARHIAELPDEGNIMLIIDGTSFEYQWMVGGEDDVRWD